MIYTTYDLEPGDSIVLLDTEAASSYRHLVGRFLTFVEEYRATVPTTILRDPVTREVYHIANLTDINDFELVLRDGVQIFPAQESGS